MARRRGEVAKKDHCEPLDGHFQQKILAMNAADVESRLHSPEKSTDILTQLERALEETNKPYTQVDNGISGETRSV